MMAALVVLGVLPLIVWLGLVLAHGRFWTADQRDDRAQPAAPAAWPAVVAVIPVLVVEIVRIVLARRAGEQNQS